MVEGVSFENYNGMKMPEYDRFASASKLPLFSRILMRLGVAKDEAQAKKILIGIIASLLVLSGIIAIMVLRPVKIKSVNIRIKPPTQTDGGAAAAESVPVSGDVRR